MLGLLAFMLGSRVGGGQQTLCLRIATSYVVYAIVFA
jgi:hypothetical protein